MEYIQKFKNYLLALRPTPSKMTVKNYSLDVKHFIIWLEAKQQSQINPDAVTYAEIQSFVEENANRLSARSLERHLSSLRKFFQCLKLEGIIPANPFDQAQVKSNESTDPYHLRQFKDFLYVYNASNLTIKNYIIDVKQFFSWVEKVMGQSVGRAEETKNGLSQISPALINEYKDRLVSENIFSSSSINRKLSSLRKYLTWAKSQNLLENENGLQINPNVILNIPSARSSEMPNTAMLQATETLVTISQQVDTKTAKEKGNEYSPFPPLRLAQKITKGISHVLDSVFIAPLAHGYVQFNRILWVAKGKPLFTKNTTVFPASRRVEAVKNISKAFYNPLSLSTKDFPWYKKLFHHARYTRPNWYKRYHSYALAHYFNWAILMIVMTVIGFGFYNGFAEKPKGERLLAATAPPRILSFQGRLTDTSNNPITTATNLRFAVYNDLTATGSALQWQEVNGVTPDTNGVFSVILGKGTVIPQSLFANNASLYLGISVGQTAELTPRQQLATVAYATNAETLQGLPPITNSGGSTTNVVLALNSSGNLSIGAASTFQTTSGAFTLAGDALIMNTNAGTNGNITLSPDGSGFIDVQKGLQNSTSNNRISSAKGSVEVDDTFAVLATNSGVAAVTINQNGSAPIFTASSSGVSKFTIGNSGTITANNYTTNGGLFFTDTTGLFSQTATGTLGQCLTSNGGGAPIWTSCSSASNNLWVSTNGALYPINGTLDLLVGGTSTAASKFAVLNMDPGAAGTAVASISAQNAAGQAIAIDSAGTIQTLRNAGLTIGGNTTGNITLSPLGGNGTVTVNGTGLQTTAATFNLLTNTATTVNFAQAATALNVGATGGTTTVNSALTITGNITPNGQFAASLIPTSTAINLGSSTNNFGSVFATNLFLPSSGGTGGFWQLNTGALSPTNITNDVLVGGTSTTSAKFSVLNMTGSGTPVASVSSGLSGNATFITADGTLQTARFQGLTVGGATTGNITLNPRNATGTITFSGYGPGLIHSNASGLLSSSAVNLAGGATEISGFLPVGNGGLGGDVTPAGGGEIVYSTSTTAYTHLAAGSTGQCLTSNGTLAPSWTSCSSAASNFWTVANGSIFPINSTLDLLVGGSATTTAKFSVLNMTGSGTPVASVSSGLNGVSAFLTATGNLATTNMQPLTLGGTTTGAITIGTDTTARSISIGNSTGATSVSLTSGTGNITLNAGSNTINMNAPTIATNQTTVALLNSTATTVNFASAASTLTLGATTGITTFATPSIDDSSTGLTLFVTPTTVNFGTSSQTVNVKGNATIGTSTSNTITLNGLLSGAGVNNAVQPVGNGVTDLGSAAHNWGTVYASNFISPVSGGTSGFWQLTNNVLSPVNQWNDLAIGNNATASATPWQVFATTVGVNTAGTATSSAGLSFRGANTNVALLNGSVLNIKTSVGGDAGLTTQLTLANNGDLTLNGSNIITTQSTLNLFNTTATLINFGGAATTGIVFGNSSGTSTLHGNLLLGDVGKTINPVGRFSNDLLPDSDNTRSLGENTTPLRWKNLFLSGNIILGPNSQYDGFWQRNLGVLSPANITDDLAIGGTSTTSAKFQIFANTGNATTSGKLTFNNATGSIIETTNMYPLTLGSATTGPIQLSPKGTTGLYVAGSGNVGINTTNPSTFPLQVAGSAGPNADNTYDLGSSLLEWRDLYLARNLLQPATAQYSGFWQLNNGALSPTNITNDLLVGATATTSAKFAVLNMANGTPVASVSSGLNGTGMYFDANGIIQTVRNMGLTLGGTSTGNIILKPVGGTAGAFTSSFGDINPDVTDSRNLGSPTLEWNNLYVRQIVTPSTGGIAGFWQLNNGVLSPSNLTNDLAIKGVGTSSAKFQVFANTFDGAPPGTASTSGYLTFNGAVSLAKVNLLNSSSLGFFNSTIDDSGLGATAALYISSGGLVSVGNNSPVSLFNVGTTSQFQVDSAGRVGIGAAIDTTSSLIVGGTINANGQLLKNVGNMTLCSGCASYTWSDNPNGTTFMALTNMGKLGLGTGTTGMGNGQLVINQNNNSGLGDIFAASSAASTKFLITNSGTVGIGSDITDSSLLSTAGLDIQKNAFGTAAFNVNQLSVVSDILTASSSGATQFRLTNGGILLARSFQDLDDSRYFIDPAASSQALDISGSAGIGTTSAQYKLDVYGDMRVGKDNTDWGVTGYGYRRQITINNTSGAAQINYQVRLTIDTATLITNGKITSTSCNDMRITDTDGATLLNYWIEPGSCNTTRTTIWVKIPSIQGPNKMVYLYYGKSGDSAVSSSTNTFIREISGVQAAYRLDEPTYNPINDFSGNGNVASASATTVVSPGKFGNARSFTGVTSNYIAASTSASINITGALSTSAWVYLTASNENAGIIDKTINNLTNKQYLLFIDGGKAKFRVVVGGVLKTAGGSTANLSLNTWHHIVGTYAGGTNGAVTVYIDNVADATTDTATAPLDSGQGDLLMGKLGSEVYFLNGRIDEPRIYNVALSTAQIADLYGNGGNNLGYVVNNNPNLEEVRAYTATEPTIGSYGQEQNSLTQMLPSFYVQQTTGNVALGTLSVASTSALLTVAGDIKSGLYDPTAWIASSNGESYRARIAVDNTNSASSSANANYQVKITTNTSTPIALGKMRSDCNDVRFSDADGTTSLTYWVETTTCNTANTIFWVKVPQLPPGEKKNIYMYYGNSSLAAASSTGVFTRTITNVQASYRFDETSGSTVTDYSSNSNTGTATGTVIRAGAMNNGRFFNGATDSVSVSNSTSINFNGADMSVDLWVNPGTVTQASLADIFNKADGVAANGGYTLELKGNPNQYAFLWSTGSAYTCGALGGGAGNWSGTGIALTAGVWQHVAITYVNSTRVATAYVNGVQVSTCTGSAAMASSATLPLLFGKQSNVSAHFWNGALDEVHFYNKALSGAEVTDLYGNAAFNTTALWNGYSTTNSANNLYIRAFTNPEPVTTVDTEQDPSQVDPTLYVNNTFGRVGIGTANPTAALNVMGTSGWDSNNMSLTARFEDTSTTGVMVMLNALNGGRNWGLISGSTNAGVGAGKFGIFDQTAGQYRMAIDTSGNVGIGTTTPNMITEIVGSTGSFGSQLRLRNSAGGSGWDLGPDSSSNNIIVYSQGGVGGMFMGNTATAWTARSDERLKDNIASLSGTLLGLSAIRKLHPVSFNWKDAHSDPQKIRLGFIAQEVQQVFPEIVDDSGSNLTITLADGSTQTIHNVLGVQYEGLIAPAIAAIKELDASQSTAFAKIQQLQNLELTQTGDVNIIANATPSANFAIPHYYTLSNALTNPINRMSAFVELVVGNLRAGGITAQEIATNSLAIATDNVSIAGQSLRDYIVGVVQNAINNGTIQTASPIASINQLHTGIVSPLGQDDSIALSLGNSRIEVRDGASGSAVASIDNKGNATFSGTLNSQNLAVNADATISGTLHAGKIVADDIVGLRAAVGTLSAQNITNVTNIYFSTPSGTPTGENYAMGSGSNSSSSSGLLNPYFGYTNLASYSAFLAYVPNLSASTAMFDQGLMSLGTTSLSDTTITGQLSIGTSLILANNSINVLGSSFEIQPLRQGGVNFEGGLIAIDTDGNLTVNGNAVFAKNLAANIISPLSNDRDLTFRLGENQSATGSALATSTFAVQNASGSGIFAINQLGDIMASGAANIGKLNFNVVQPALAVSNIEVIATGSAGTTFVKAHQTEVTIDNKLVTDKSLIYITPVGQSNVTPYLLRQVNKTSFTVGIPLQQLQDTTFNWLIVN